MLRTASIFPKQIFTLNSWGFLMGGCSIIKPPTKPIAPVISCEFLRCFITFEQSQLPKFLVIITFKTYCNHITILNAVSARARNRVPRRLAYQPPLPKNQLGDRQVFLKFIACNFVLKTFLSPHLIGLGGEVLSAPQELSLKC